MGQNDRVGLFVRRKDLWGIEVFYLLEGVTFQQLIKIFGTSFRKK